MNDLERATGIDNQLQSYSPHPFTTTDARQLSFDNFEALWFRQSGLTGALFNYNMNAANPASGFGPSVSVNGLGGTPSPISNAPMPPLIANADFAETFVRNVTGKGAMLY